MSVDALSLPICGRGTALVTEDHLNARQQPMVTADVVCQWRKGQVLTVWAKDKYWLLVQDPVSGAAGWSHGDFLEIDGELIP